MKRKYYRLVCYIVPKSVVASKSEGILICKEGRQLKHDENQLLIQQLFFLQYGTSTENSNIKKTRKSFYDFILRRLI